jgi:hypothetical protein
MRRAAIPAVQDKITSWERPYRSESFFTSERCQAISLRKFRLRNHIGTDQSDQARRHVVEVSHRLVLAEQHRERHQRLGYLHGHLTSCPSRRPQCARRRRLLAEAESANGT